MSDITLAHAGFGNAVEEHIQIGTDCAVHEHRSHIPMCWHHVWPQGMGGPDTQENKVHLCYNAHYLIHEYIRQLMRYAGDVPRGVSMFFSYKVRDLAEQGWKAAGSPTAGTFGE